ncbi:MAG: hypothetical protein ACT4OD_03580 [Candidatus Nitrosotenuis sp.]
MKNVHLGLFVAMILALGAIVSPLSTSAQTYQQIISTNAGTLKVGISTNPASPKSGEQSKLKIDFLNPQTNAIQEHIDYTVLVTKDGIPVFGPIPLTHTSLGTATIPVQFKDGEHQVVIDVQGILFRPIPSEKATFSITIGEKQSAPTQPKEEQTVAEKSKPTFPDIVKDKAKDSKSDKKDVKKDPKKDKKKDVKKKTTKKQVKKTTNPY